MEPLIDRFVDYLAYERGLSPRTRAAYASDLRNFMQFLARRGRSTGGVACIREIGADDVSAFMEEGRRLGLADSTLARRLVSVKVFFAYLRAEGVVEVDVASQVEAARRTRRLPHVVPEDGLARMLSLPPDTRDGLRDRAMLELLYGCGLRESELIELKIDSLRFDDGLVRCVGKGSKVRLVPMGGKAEEALVRYLKDSRWKYRPSPSDATVFLNSRGVKMSRMGVWGVVKKYARAAGLDAGVSPHWLRHSFATHMLSNGASVRAIQEMLGHADIGTTNIYTHVDASRLREVHSNHHPRA